MAKKFTFQCISCNWKCDTDKTPNAIRYCVDCGTHLGLCLACQKDIIRIHDSIQCAEKRKKAERAANLFNSQERS